MTDRALTPDLARRVTLDAEPWLSCDDCFAGIDEYVDKLITDPGWENAKMRAHLRGCGACAEEARSLLELAAHDSGVDPEPLLANLGR